MDLGLAGVISGAGQGVEKSLATTQVGFQASQLQAERDKMDTLRQERLIAAQHTEAEATRAATSKESALTRTSQESIARKHIASSENIARESNAVHKEMNEATNQMHRDVARWELMWKKQHTAKTDLQAKITGVAAVISEQGTKIDRLSVIVNKLEIDPSSPEYKSAVQRIAQAQKVQDAFIKYQAQLTGMSEHLQTDVGAAMPQASGKQPAIIDPYKTPGAAARSSSESLRASGPRGLVQTPLPSEDEQALMQSQVESVP